MEVFDRVFVYYMDRLVWFILLVVTSNLVFTAVGISGVGADSVDLPVADAEENQVIENASPVNADKITNDAELYTHEQMESTTQATPKADRPTRIFAPSNNNRIALLDSIFNIPIATLKAVNELVQSIAGSITSSRTGFSGEVEISGSTNKGKN